MVLVGKHFMVMNSPCKLCPVHEGVCPGLKMQALCAWVDTDSPRFHANGETSLIRMAKNEPDPGVVYSHTKPESPHSYRDIPLAGDIVEAIARRIGADRLAAWWEAKTGRGCGCGARKEAMNRATEKLLKWAGMVNS